MAEPPLRLKITKLHVERYRSLGRVAWPEDGLGWGDTVPDTVLEAVARATRSPEQCWRAWAAHVASRGGHPDVCAWWERYLAA